MPSFLKVYTTYCTVPCLLVYKYILPTALFHTFKFFSTSTYYLQHCFMTSFLQVHTTYNTAPCLLFYKHTNYCTVPCLLFYKHINYCTVPCLLFYKHTNYCTVPCLLFYKYILLNMSMLRPCDVILPHERNIYMTLYISSTSVQKGSHCHDR